MNHNLESSIIKAYSLYMLLEQSKDLLPDIKNRVHQKNETDSGYYQKLKEARNGLFSMAPRGSMAPLTLIVPVLQFWSFWSLEW